MRNQEQEGSLGIAPKNGETPDYHESNRATAVITIWRQVFKVINNFHFFRFLRWILRPTADQTHVATLLQVLCTCAVHRAYFNVPTVNASSQTDSNNHYFFRTQQMLFIDPHQMCFLQASIITEMFNVALITNINSIKP